MVLDLSMLDDAEYFRSSATRGRAERAPLSSFEEDPDNPRFESLPEEFAALVENVRLHGILQPIVVRRLENNRLRIRFGARRFRAAMQLGLPDAPYVVTEDPRQLDDYSQIAENERRTSLQPLELATFIAKKLAQGESKSAVATKLGIHPSAVTQLLCLTGDVLPFVLELYHSRVCRSPQYLYRLTKLWRIDARLVEDACAGATEVGLQLVEAIEASVKKTGTAAPDPGPASTTSVSPVPIERTSIESPIVPQTRSGSGRENAMKGAKSRLDPKRASDSHRSRLFGTVDGAAIELLIFVRPSSDRRVVVRYANELIESEIDLARIVLTKVVPHS
jgi:ParB family chromosome partitioning protein